MNILLTADESAGHQAFRLMKNSSHNISGVVTPASHPALRKHAAEAEIPVLEPTNLTDPAFSGWIREHQVDVLLNVHLLYIIHPEILKALAFDAFNLHPGRLPDYAGLNTPSWAIYNGETEQSVTLHRIEPGIDTGSIAYSTAFPIQPDDTGLTLSLRCAKEGLGLISDLLEALQNDPLSIPSIEQDLNKRHYYGKHEKPQNGHIDWSLPATVIEAFIRACSYRPFKSPWGYPLTEFEGNEIGIASASISGNSCREMTPGTIGTPTDDWVPIATSDHWLFIKKCSVNEKIISASSLLKPDKILK